MRREIPTVIALALGAQACGDNAVGAGVPLAPSAELVVVAHQDDDLLLMQPDILEAIEAGSGVTTVYVTAGNGAHGGLAAARRRYEGVKAAYAFAAGSSDWTCGYITVAAHPVEHCRLPAQSISLVFVGYPDGGKMGQYPSSLLRLWEGAIDHATTVSDEPSTYDREGLVALLLEIIREVSPATIRTLDVTNTHGRDHADHLAVSAMTALALAASERATELVSYRGYDIDAEQPNKASAIYDATRAMLARYEACATGCAPCGDACTTIEEQHLEWLQRRYAIGFRRSAGGKLRTNNLCLDEALHLGSCSGAPTWRLDPYGELRVKDRCLTAATDGSLSLDICAGGTARHFIVDDDGHIASMLPPPPSPDAAESISWCLSPDDSGVTLGRCGVPTAPTWELAPDAVETDRAGIWRTGREVRLGDITGDGRADLCMIDNGLYCAAGNGNGTFAAASRIDSSGQPLDVEPKSLFLGDVDDDGHPDACGRDASGILCATFAEAYAAERWTTAFSDTDARATTSASLTTLDVDGKGAREICGFDRLGVLCAKPGTSSSSYVLSTSPPDNAVVWLTDLDGDDGADWCTATDTGPACAVLAERDRTTDPAPWGYSEAGTLDILPANTATVAFGDIDPDGRADYCAAREDRIICARSNERGFGPRETTLAILPNQSVASALWLGDLDGDGRADLCADTGTTIACAVQP